MKLKTKMTKFEKTFGISSLLWYVKDDRDILSKGEFMKAIILCAGYGTRLYPLTENKPKALLEVKGKSLIDMLVDSLEKIEAIDEIIVVSNDRFYNQFCEWGTARKKKTPLTILNDFTTSNDNRLGAIGDIKYAIQNLQIDDDVFIGSSDMYFDFEMKDFYDYFIEKDADAILGEYENDIKVLQRKGVAVLGEDNRIVEIEEKVQNPKGNFILTAFYLYKKESIREIDQYLAEGNNPDAPGHFPAWLCKHKPVYAMENPGECVDIGTIDDYNYLNGLK